MKIVYDEWYGELSYAQRAAYRKHNISPADHGDLVQHFGRDAHAEITAYVKHNVAKYGTYNSFDMWSERL